MKPGENHSRKSLFCFRCALYTVPYGFVIRFLHDLVLRFISFTCVLFIFPFPFGWTLRLFGVVCGRFFFLLRFSFFFFAWHIFVEYIKEAEFYFSFLSFSNSIKSDFNFFLFAVETKIRWRTTTYHADDDDNDDDIVC